MKNYFKACFAPLVVLGIVLGAFMIPACTDVDDTLGENIIPGDENMVFNVSTVTGVDGYLVNTDSTIPMTNFNRMVIGSIKSGDFGVTMCGSAFQMAPMGDTTPLKYKPHVDTVGMYLYIRNVNGNSAVKQDFYVYALSEDLERDKDYYPTTVDPSKMADLSKPLFEFSMQDEVAGSRIFKDLIPVGDGSAAEEYINSLIDAPSWIFEPDSTPAFRKQFKGLFILPKTNAAGEPELKDAALYTMEFATTDYTSYSRIDLTFFYISGHNHKKNATTSSSAYVCPGYEDCPEQDQDSLFHIAYSFDDFAAYQYPNTSLISIKHFYDAGSPMAPSNYVDPKDSLSLSGPKDVIYVQTLSGVAGYLDFSTQIYDMLEQLKTHEGEEYSVINVNNAKLFMPLAGVTEQNINSSEAIRIMDEAPARLGMYHTYRAKTPFSLLGLYSWGSYTNYNDFMENAPRGISDYGYLYEYSSEYPNYYGGKLNRSHGRYEMDISYYIRDLANNPETGKRIWLAPSWNMNSDYTDYAVTAMLTPRQVALNTADMKLVITYTLIK